MSFKAPALGIGLDVSHGSCRTESLTDDIVFVGRVKDLMLTFPSWKHHGLGGSPPCLTRHFVPKGPLATAVALNTSRGRKLLYPVWLIIQVQTSSDGRPDGDQEASDNSALSP